MVMPPPLPSPIPTLSPEHVAQIAQARVAGAKIRRCATVATIGGWVTAVFAGVTPLTSIFSMVGLALGVGMAVISFFEFRGASEVKRLDLRAPKRLAINQIAFSLLLTIYAGISLWQNLNTKSPELDQFRRDPQVAQLIGNVDDLTRSISIAVYGGVIAVAFIGPGLTAVYYHSRRKHLLKYLKTTPSWILDLQRAGMQI